MLRQLEACRGGTYLPLDDSTLRAAAQADPDVFVADGAKPMMIDEIQRGGDDLVLAIKSPGPRAAACCAMQNDMLQTVARRDRGP